MPIKAVFTDMDGTLLNPHHKVSDYTIAAIKGLKAKGVDFIVATGRPYADVFETIRLCGFEPDYIITCNGARVHDKTYNMISSEDMDPAIVQEIVRLRHAPNDDGHYDPAHPLPKPYSTNLYRNDEWVMDKHNPKLAPEFNDTLKECIIGEALHEFTLQDCEGVHQAWFLGEPETLPGIDAYMKHKYADTLRCSYSLPYLLDCVPISIHKGKAMEQVASMLNIGVADCAAFGDGMNDRTMLQTAGHPFIMSNGQAALKAAVPNATVIGSNAEDGVAKKLVELFSL